MPTPEPPLEESAGATARPAAQRNSASAVGTAIDVAGRVSCLDFNSEDDASELSVFFLAVHERRRAAGGWDDLATPALDETGRVCHSPLSPILAQAMKFIAELPDSVESDGTVEEYATDNEAYSVVEETIQSAC
jgi:hypothetical protein